MQARNEFFKNGAAAAPSFRAALADAHARHLNVYTTEQEADELAVDILAALGTQSLANMVFRLWALLPAEPLPTAAVYHTIDRENCLLYAKNDFKNRDGTTQWIAEGTYTNQYHQPCFRVFNIFRQARAKGYTLSPLP